MFEKLNSFLYNHKSRVLFFVKLLSGIAVISSMITLILRYGFSHTDDDLLGWQRLIDAVFTIYVLIYIGRLSVAFKRDLFIKNGFFEFLLIAFAVFHGAINLLFDYRILNELIGALGAQSPFLSAQHIFSLYLGVLWLMELSKISTVLNRISLKPASIFIISFILLILIGALMLMLPAMTTQQGSMSFLDAVFTSASASCVTGLVVVNTATFFTFKGQMIIMLLIQLGGIGVISFLTFFATFLAKGVGLKHQSMIQDFLGTETLFSAKGFLRQIVLITVSIEVIGAVCIYISWYDVDFQSNSQRIFFSIFHSISAFCNGGFSLFSDGLYQEELVNELTGEVIFPNVRAMYGMHTVTAFIIIFGSLGYSTIEDLFSYQRIKERLRNPWKKLQISTSIALYSTLILIVVGMLAFLYLEHAQLADKNINQALALSFFQSVTTRTAGFNTMDFGSLQTPTIIVTLFLMFIGAMSGSTGGGIKLTTAVVIFLSAWSSITGQKRIILGRKTLSDELVKRAFTIFIFAVSYNFIAIFALSITEAPDTPILKIAFEQISAFATAGLSMGLTGDLSSAGKVIIIISMFLGRVGMITLALSISSTVNTNAYKYPKTTIMVG